MCGVFGRFAAGKGRSNADDLFAATRLLEHRGPDAEGHWVDDDFFLGHRRLSIIDLVSGEQPLLSFDERYVIAFNGEIYNYIELRRELVSCGARFQTKSDTEVIVEAYRAWGTDAPKRLEGMFAFAIVDRRERSLFLARDRFGEKPLFYRETLGGSVTFASEIKALLRSDAQPISLDPSALLGFLCLNYVPGHATLVEGVTRLEPGCWRLYACGRPVQTGRYWSPPDPNAPPNRERDPSRLMDRLQELLDDSVRQSLRSDVPVTLFLSGGIDSSLVAESAVRQGQIKTAYCLDFQDAHFSEWPNASAVAKRLGLELRRATARPPTPEVFQRIVYYADDPLADSSAVAVWYLAEEVAEDFKVVITGDGGDELFGGYLTYQATLLYDRLYRLLPGGALRLGATLANRIVAGDAKVTFGYKLKRLLRAFGLPPEQAHFTWNGAWLPEDALGLMDPELRASAGTDLLAGLAETHGLGHTLDLSHLQRADAIGYLANDILVKVDRMAMAHGLESRAPYLMPRFAEFALGLPAAVKCGAVGKTKRIMRSLMARTFGPELANAKKQGFSIPVHRWLRSELRPIVETYLTPQALGSVPFLDADAVMKAKEAHLSGRAQLGFELWGLLVLIEWWSSIHSATVRAHTRVGAQALGGQQTRNARSIEQIRPPSGALQ